MIWKPSWGRVHPNRNCPLGTSTSNPATPAPRGWPGNRTAEAGGALVDAFARLGEYSEYTLWYGDHEALMACHASPVHYFIIEALDAMGSTHARRILPDLTPCWRAAVAWALGRIGDPRAAPVLLKVVADLDNATDTRHAAAEALGRIADPSSLESARKLAGSYPEVSTRRALLRATARAGTDPHLTE